MDKWILITEDKIINIDSGHNIEFINENMWANDVRYLPKPEIHFKYKSDSKNKVYHYIKKTSGDKSNYWKVEGIQRVTELSSVKGEHTFKAVLYVKNLHKLEDCSKVEEKIRSVKIKMVNNE